MATLPEPRIYPAAILPVAETCPGSLALTQVDPWNAGIDWRWREAFRLGTVTPPSAHSVETYRQVKGWLPDFYAVHVEAALEGYRRELGTTSLPSAHRRQVVLDMDLEGRLPAKGDVRILAQVDCAWTEAHDGGKYIAVGLSHELAALGRRPVDDLDLAFVAIALAAFYDVERVKVGRCYHSPTRDPEYVWSKVFDEASLMGYWERITKIFRAPHALVDSPRCEMCAVRRKCSQWILPTWPGTPLSEMQKTLTGQQMISHAESLVMRRHSKRLREVAEMIDGQLRAYQRDQGAA